MIIFKNRKETMDPVGDRFMELAKIQQEAYQSASLQSELFTLQKMVMHLQSEINRVQEKIEQTPVGKAIKKAQEKGE